MNLLLEIIILVSYTTYYIKKQTNNLFFSILDIFSFLWITSVISMISSFIIINYPLRTLHKILTTVNFIFWFVCSINLPLTVLQCNTLTSYSNEFDCYYETKSLMLSTTSLFLWGYIICTQYPRLLKYIYIICAFLIIYNEIVYDLLIYFNLFTDDQSRYTLYKISENYILTRFNKFYIEYH
jgi:hypothetical protein